MNLLSGILAILLIATPVYAADDGGVFGNIGVFAPLAILIAIFYFFIIRPQNKRLSTHRELIAGLRRGDVVITSGGIIGKVHRIVDDNECVIEIAENVRVKVVKSTITGKQGEEPTKPTKLTKLTNLTKPTKPTTTSSSGTK